MDVIIVEPTMSDQIAKNVPNFIPMGQAGGERVKQDDAVELDAEGKPVNPHIPQFISKAPWYLDSGAKSSLKHQRLATEKGADKIEAKNGWYRRGERLGPAATKYRKGACENCGASTHPTKDCLERPRKIGAKWSGQDIQADEVVQSIQTTWDSKRDRANGYDFDNHAAILKASFDRVEALRAERGQHDSNVDNDEANPQSVADQTKSTSNSHMRIREDTANYLAKDRENDSYDPKTRTMKDAVPSAGAGIDKKDFTRGTGDAAAFTKLQAFAWNEQATGSTTDEQKKKLGQVPFGDVHAQAAPSHAALLYKQKLASKAAEKADILDKYGNDTQALPSHLLEVANDQKVYSKEGQLLTPKRVVRSKYNEDVLNNGHTSVWGSWYNVETAQWGYKCCHNILKNAYCTADK